VTVIAEVHNSDGRVGGLTTSDPTLAPAQGGRALDAPGPQQLVKTLKTHSIQERLAKETLTHIPRTKRLEKLSFCAQIGVAKHASRCQKTARASPPLAKSYNGRYISIPQPLAVSHLGTWCCVPRFLELDVKSKEILDQIELRSRTTQARSGSVSSR